MVEVDDDDDFVDVNPIVDSPIVPAGPIDMAHVDLVPPHVPEVWNFHD